MFENPRRGRQARNFATKVSKILDLKSSSEQIFFRKLSLGAPVYWRGSLRRRHSESLYRPGGGGYSGLQVTGMSGGKIQNL